MKDSSTGGLLAFIMTAPVVVICCDGKVALVGTALFGIVGLSAVVGYLDYVLLPALAVFALITIYTLIRRARKT